VVVGPIRDLANVGGLFRKTTAATSTASTRGLPARHVSPGVRRGKERGAGFNISDIPLLTECKEGIMPLLTECK
jgi:hypothetical protein